MISVDAVTQKEVKTDPQLNPQSKSFYLSIVQQISQGINPPQICKKLNITKQNLQYYLTKLKQAGVIRKLGYGTWEIADDKFLVKKEVKNHLRLTMNDPSQLSLYLFEQDSVRGHAFTFTLKIPEHLRNWTNKNRESFLAKNNINFTNLTTFGGGQRIKFKGRKIWLTNKSVIIYEKSSYLAETATDAKSHAIYNFISLIKSLERLLHADFTERAGRQYTFKVSRQHYALIKNALAKQYNAEGKKLNVSNENGLWFVIDNSYNLKEAETVHPETADTDNATVQNWFNGLKEQPITPEFLTQTLNGILQSQQNNQQIQSVFSDNMSSHIQVLKDIGINVNNLTKLIEELKGHGQLSKGQRTLEVSLE